MKKIRVGILGVAAAAALCFTAGSRLSLCQGGVADAHSADRALPVLMYHHIVEDGEPCNDMTITVSRMEQDLRWLTEHGYHTVLPRELAGGEPLPEKPLLITFDDGYRSNYELLFPLLQAYQMKAVVSIMVYMQDVSADNFLSWDMCREMADSGLVEIGSHAYSLHNLGDLGGNFDPGGHQRHPKGSGGVGQCLEARVLGDIQKSHDRIAQEVGQPVTSSPIPSASPSRTRRHLCMSCSRSLRSPDTAQPTWGRDCMSCHA